MLLPGARIRALTPAQVISWLQQHWTLPDGSLHDRARLIDLQIEPFAGRRPFDALMLWLVAALVVICAQPTLPVHLGLLWLAVLALNPTSKFWLPVLMRRLQPRARMRLRWLCVQACVTALLFALPVLWIFRQSDQEALRVFLVIVGAGVLSAELVSYNRLPPVALCWMLTYLAVALQLTAFMSSAMSLALVMACALYVVSALKGSLEASRDLMRRGQAEFESERQTENLALVLNDIELSSRDWFWECDAEGRLTHASASMVNGLGRAGSLDHVLLTEALSAHARPGTQASWSAILALSDRLRAGRPFRDATVPMDIGGQTRWWSFGAKPLIDRQGHLTGWRGTAVNVSETHLNEQALSHQASTDALTELGNRRGLQCWLEERLGASTPSSARPVALLLLDLDGFKQVNDAHGHVVGDQLLQSVARRLDTLAPGSGRWFRLGGDEFAFGVSPPPTRPALARWSTQLLTQLAEPHAIQDLQLETRASIGLAYAPADARTPSDLLQASDIALHAAKAAGGHRAQLIDDDTRRRVKMRARMTHDLANSIAHRELRLSYQPLFDAQDGRAVGAEALLRWDHRELGAVPPETFIDLAERTGLIVPLGAWALEQACREAALWPPHTRLAVNLSARQLNSPALLTQVRRALAHSDLPPHRLELEVTETALMDEAAAAPVLEALKSLGVMLILDDFGTGFSALGYLQRLTFDGLKIDRSFVRPLLPDAPAKTDAMLRAIVDMAHALGLPCTAEGVENDHQMQRLKSLGCHTLQGYHLAAPMSAEDVQDLLRAHARSELWSPTLV